MVDISQYILPLAAIPALAVCVWIYKRIKAKTGRVNKLHIAFEKTEVSFDREPTGASTASGDARNLALLGTDEDSGDLLYLNYNGEYDQGVYISNPTYHSLRSFGPSSGSAYFGVYGGSGSYYGALGRADGYSYVGSGTLYNNGTAYATSFLYLSDKRLKENIEPLARGLPTILALKPVSFIWKSDVIGEKAGSEDIGFIAQSGPREGEADIGFIAQEVEKVVPQVVHTDANGMKSIDYGKLVPILVRAIQENQAEIEALQNELLGL